MCIPPVHKKCHFYDVKIKFDDSSGDLQKIEDFFLYKYFILNFQIWRLSLKMTFKDSSNQQFFFYKFSPNPLIGRIGKDRALAKQSLLRWPCPLPSDRAIPGLWQNLESKV